MVLKLPYFALCHQGENSHIPKPRPTVRISYPPAIYVKYTHIQYSTAGAGTTGTPGGGVQGAEANTPARAARAAATAACHAGAQPPGGRITVAVEAAARAARGAPLAEEPAEKAMAALPVPSQPPTPGRFQPDDGAGHGGTWFTAAEVLAL